MYGEETVIVNGMGYFCDAFIVTEDRCAGCPYAVADVDGNMACYADSFKKCNNGEEVDE